MDINIGTLQQLDKVGGCQTLRIKKHNFNSFTCFYCFPSMEKSHHTPSIKMHLISLAFKNKQI